MITCHVCGSKKVKHYRQMRSDGKSVVTARCENGHIPEKGKPFYPKWQFNIDALPPLSSSANNEQPELFAPKPAEELDLIQLKRQIYNKFPAVKR